jgi:hypothetical protein
MVQSSLTDTLHTNCPKLLALVKSGLLSVNSNIIHDIGKKQVAIASGAIGLSALVIYELIKFFNKMPKK